ncbi:branched-chain amino acid ABC transporter permease [Bordetella pertussis]|uniref:Branched-chain amino acid transport system permease protein n=1 Tax=Bordetella pertussis (strain ATCC 9797 / DSM 5571 / CCUG 30873 / LMG 14455 / NCTC 10739 / 18323) TaxID=568706 RepID=A0A0T7CK87_BORP1|nr:branched-chain amino acid ABC transporter permease [Bordetella pertussis]AZR83734.1 branched-chain amino acid ABC transporter permease [Bordetella pertussis]PNO99799.1 branched-chain amino acid ABC transporter permease [Bordetella pertussis 18323]UEB56519.1 branched-chain amino acid ABC transporter permease [Bordetella pertussis]CCJ61910.1 putative branched-chain amino acid transport system permease protein [Bordetella pertussis 18323]CFP50254.1 branched-chain amino acid ABC transporter per
MFRRKYGTALCALVLIALPALLNDPFITHLGVRAATYAIVVMGLTLFAGYTGQISLGHAAFFGLAAYLSGMMAKAGVPYLVSVPVATAAVGVLGCLVGMLVLRTSGHYLALASIAVAVIVQAIIKNSTITGGPSGLTAVPAPDFFGWSLTSDLGYYYYVLLCMFAGFVILRRVIDSRTGDALQAIANNELAAQSLGIPVFRYKVLSFTISTLFAAFAGTLFVHYDGFIDPDRLGIHVSVLFLIMTFVGGIGNIYGSVIGAFALTIIEECAQEFGQYNILVYGLLLALVILFLPKGLVDLPNKLKSLRAR